MSANHDRSHALSTAAESDMVGYSAISPAAIVALLLGVASFFAIGNLLLLILPALAILAAIFAFVSIARSDGGVSGRWAAVAGLALALAFASTAIVRSTTRAWHLRNEAHAVADKWLDLVRRGKLHQAHQWHLPPQQRQLATTPLAQYYHDSKTAQTDFDSFFRQMPLVDVVDALPHADPHFVSVAEQIKLEKNDRVALLYEIEPPQAKSGEPLRFVVITERTADADTGAGKWQISGVAPPQAPTP
jgi:hypothetical protein